MDAEGTGWRRGLRLDARAALVCREGHALAHIEATSADLPQLRISPRPGNPPPVLLDGSVLSFRCPTCGHTGQVDELYLIRLFAAMLTHGPAQLRVRPSKASINRAIGRIVPTDEPAALRAVRYARSGRPPSPMPTSSAIAAAAGLPLGSMLVIETARQTGAELDTPDGPQRPSHEHPALGLLLGVSPRSSVRTPG